MTINWGGSVDDIVTSWQKPAGTYAAVATLCGLAVFCPDTRVLVIPILGALAGINGGLRTYEKTTAMKTAVAPGATP